MGKGLVFLGRGCVLVILYAQVKFHFSIEKSRSNLGSIGLSITAFTLHLVNNVLLVARFFLGTTN